MKYSRLLCVLCTFVTSIFSNFANASLVVPADLSPGDRYHVIFVSSTTRDTLSSNIADYDSHVQAAADAAGIGTSIGLDWLAVGSTSSMDAIDHLSPLFTSTNDIPIYNQNGDLVSQSFIGLWDSSIDNAVAYTETGLYIDRGPVFTGTETNGLASNNPLGSQQLVSVGVTSQADSNWIDALVLLPSGTGGSLYALSAEVVVPEIPIPAGVWLFGSGLLGLVGIARRKKTV